MELAGQYFIETGDEFATEVATRLKELPDDGHAWSEYAQPYDKLIAEAAIDPKKEVLAG